ncbi:putative esterase [Aureobasidium sp. EXF-12298]|nr:putative esterase [Aureobasidium sp. EXF-12298]KAI4782035.1 putative esterase [Aureobasidium sp. EXF-3400]
MTKSLVASPPCGPVQGFRSDHVVKYTGIPYGKAARFQIPQPIEDWADMFQATSPSAACPQPKVGAPGLITKAPLLQGLDVREDCHHLSITVPESAKSGDKLPVMVYVYGGSFETGAADSPAYEPSKLVAENQVIVVNINYRLNLFGFLGDGKSRPANLGLLDQLQALRWVRRNITAFGGTDDPKSITFFGESAGGSSIADLMTLPEASSLFGRAIVQSAPFGITRGRNALNNTLLKVAESVSTDMPPEELVKLCEAIHKTSSRTFPMGLMPFAPQYGHAPLPVEADVDTALNSNASQIDILVGSTDLEGSLFMPLLPGISTAINIPLLERHARAGGKASHYRIHLSNENNRFGATHTIELSLLFGDKEVYDGAKILEGFTAQQLDTAGAQMRKLWADFAKGKQLDAADSVDDLISITRI